MNNFWQQIFLGNTTYAWVVAITILIVGGVLLSILKRWALVRLQVWAGKTSTKIDDTIITGIKRSVLPMLYILLFYAAINFLTVPNKIKHKISVVIWVAVMFFVLRAFTSLVKYLIFSALRKKDESESREKQAKGLIVILTVSIWILGFIFLLDNLGYNIGTLIAGLGIGGIAVALAAQNILGDLFSYFVIFFDKPFEIGDFISIDDQSGAVEYIGLKTTRIRALGDDQIVCSNKDLTNSRLHNYGRMQKRRVVFKIRVVYQLSAQQLKEIPALVKDIIESHDKIQFDRGHFIELGKSSLDFEFVYYLLTTDYSVFMNTQQEILLSVFEAFEKEKIEFAYPTQTLFLQPSSETANTSLS